MPYGPSAHHPSVPDFGFATYRDYQSAPFGVPPQPWHAGWSAAPLAAEQAFAEPEPLLMLFELGNAFAGPAAAGAPLASLLPEVANAVRLIPEVAAGQRAAADLIQGLLQRVEALQQQVQTLSVRLGAPAPATRDE